MLWFKQNTYFARWISSNIEESHVNRQPSVWIKRTPISSLYHCVLPFTYHTTHLCSYTVLCFFLPRIWWLVLLSKSNWVMPATNGDHEKPTCKTIVSPLGQDKTPHTCRFAININVKVISHWYRKPVKQQQQKRQQQLTKKSPPDAFGFVSPSFPFFASRGEMPPGQFVLVTQVGRLSIRITLSGWFMRILIIETNIYTIIWWFWRISP